MRPESAAASIVRELVDAISVGALAPGERLASEADLAKSYDVAPMTLRRALAGLRDLGLVETRRGRHGGSYVRADVGDRLRAVHGNAAVTASAMRDLLEWRRAISGEASALAAARSTPVEVEQMWQASRDYDVVSADPGRRRLADARLHRLIAEAARSSHLERAEIEIQEELNKIILSLPSLPSFNEVLPHSHDEVLRAIAERRGEDARRAMIEHVEATHEWCSNLAGLTAG